MGLFGQIAAEFPNIETVFAGLPSASDDLASSASDEFEPDDAAFQSVASLFSTDQRRAPYEVWHLETKIIWEEGLGAMPTSPPVGGTLPQNKIGVLPVAAATNRQAIQIVRLSAPYGMMMVFWAGRRMGLQPTVPLPVVNDNAVFAGKEFHMSPPIFTEDNTPIHAWAARFLFILKKPVWYQDGISPGASPAMTLKPTDNTIPATVFAKVF